MQCTSGVVITCAREVRKTQFNEFRVDVFYVQNGICFNGTIRGADSVLDPVNYVSLCNNP